MQNLIIYKCKLLYDILEEISFDLNYKIDYAKDENNLKIKIQKHYNCLIISNKKYSNINNFFTLYELPIKIFKLIEKINTEFLKLQFSNQSNISLKKYTIDLNSREIITKNLKVKLTEKEINTIIYLSKAKKPVDINELQKKVWSYQNEIESHTVETHIYRLRKKILDTFNDNKFIISQKNGYQIK